MARPGNKDQNTNLAQIDENSKDFYNIQSPLHFLSYYLIDRIMKYGIFLKDLYWKSTVLKAMADILNFFCHYLVIELKRFQPVDAKNFPICFAIMNYAVKWCWKEYNIMLSHVLSSNLELSQTVQKAKKPYRNISTRIYV